MTTVEKALIQIKDLSISFGAAKAVDGISFSINPGETVAVVGESGSGKSVTALSLTRLLPPPPACQVEGKIIYQDRDLLSIPGDEIRKIRGKHIAYIFQEPSTSLNPVFSIGYQIEEAIRLHRPDVSDVKGEIVRVLDRVGIRDSEKRCRDYPHQLSGGMQQRVMIAMALACRPQLLVADEPTTALDVTIQAQIIELLKELKEQLSMSILLITHNFGIVSGFADRVLVMFRGRIVEEGPTQKVLNHPQHPYTQALIDCIPRLGQKKERLTTIDYSKIV
ncbi:MAG: ABC transporter ATP-binding protein [Methylacidiphilales bacterium]|nr:ABC transporter ATP-binding protein [Candidatus Methylacidiphilales bacterium]